MYISSEAVRKIASISCMVLLFSFVVSVGAMYVYAEDLPPVVDMCTNVPGDQASEPCADTQCATDGGTWNGASCDMPVVTPTCAEGEHLEGDVCVADAISAEEQMPADGVTVATSTDGTGGVAGVGGTVITGDATATTTAQNELNTNITDPDSPGESNSSTIDYMSSSTADVGSQVETLADTGINEAEGGEGDSLIVTGNAISTADVINLINTNIFNSTGLILFFNQLFGGGLDLRDFDLSYFFDGQAGASPTVNETTGEPQCTLLTCLTSSQFNVINTNTATVTNEVIVRANTGTNVASSSGDGSSSILTGDAYAAANVFNLVNTNIVNSSYLMLSFNNFGDLEGDITLPGTAWFSDLLAHEGAVPEMNSSSYDINNTNTVDFTGTTTASSETGENNAISTGVGSPMVSTGDAYTAANTYTDANSNYFGGTSVFLSFRIAGEWTGVVKDLPNGLAWTKLFDVYADQNGKMSTSTLILVLSENIADLPGAEEANCHEEDGPVNNCFRSSSFMSSSTNTALVENNVDVQANTGGNEAQAATGTAAIGTGDAYAVANVINLINTNIVGRNWIFALFNVFGDWSGDISFGRSALTLEAAASAAPTVTPGSEVVYTFTVTNNGDGTASDIELNANFDTDLLEFSDVSGSEGTDNGRRWNLGSVARGETRSYQYTARIGSVPSGTSMTIPLTATVSSDGDGSTEANVAFTVATIDVVTPPAPSSAPSGGGAGGAPVGLMGSNVANWSNPKITVAKSVSIATSTIPTNVDYKVVVTNDPSAGTASNAILTDTMYDPEGKVMYERSWDLQSLVPGDQVTLTYTVEFSTSSKPGIYRNVAKIDAIVGNPASVYSKSMVAQGVGLVELTAGGEVLGVATTAASCPALLTTYLKQGQRGTEVFKLQSFLNGQGEKLPTTSLFGPMTKAAVKRFQQKYAADVLAPLGLTSPTGAVLGMTQKKINEVNCNGAPVVGAPALPTPKVVAPTAPKPKTVAPKAPAKPVVAAPAPTTVAEAPVAPAQAPQESGGLKGWLKGFIPFVSASSN